MAKSPPCVPALPQEGRTKAGEVSHRPTLGLGPISRQRQAEPRLWVTPTAGRAALPAEVKAGFSLPRLERAPQLNFPPVKTSDTAVSLLPADREQPRCQLPPLPQALVPPAATR